MNPFKRLSLAAIFILSSCAVAVVSCTPRHDCRDVVCGNNGVCGKDAYGAIICTCPSGYGGDQCQTVLRDQFLGNWTQRENTTVTPVIPLFAVAIVAAADIAEVSIRRYYSYTDRPFKARIVDGATLYIPPQQLPEGTIEGKLYHENNFIRAEYSITDSAGYSRSVSAIWE